MFIEKDAVKSLVKTKVAHPVRAITITALWSTGSTPQHLTRFCDDRNTSSFPPTQSTHPASPGCTPTSAPSTLSCRNSHPLFLLLQRPPPTTTTNDNKNSTGAPPSSRTGPATRSLTPSPATRLSRAHLTTTSAGCPSQPPTTLPWPARPSGSSVTAAAVVRRE